MQIRFYHILIILFTITILHISSVLFGWYSGSVIWVDNIEHILAGIALSMFFIFIRKNRSSNKKKIAVHIILFVLLIAILWELFEFLLLTHLPFYATKFDLYSPTLMEALEDIISNLIGSILFILFNKNK